LNKKLNSISKAHIILIECKITILFLSVYEHLLIYFVYHFNNTNFVPPYN
jgi:hypothetical protein